MKAEDNSGNEGGVSHCLDWRRYEWLPRRVLHVLKDLVRQFSVLFSGRSGH